MSDEKKPDPVGKELRYGPTDIKEEAILKFGIGISDKNKASTDPASDNFRANPMYAATSIIPGTGMVIFQPGIGINVNKIVHGGIEIEFGKAILPGDEISNSAALIGVDDKGSGKLANIRFETTNQDGDMVARGITRYFSRGKKTDGDSPTTIEKKEPIAFSDKISFDTSTEQSRLYAAGSGDRFPIHTDDNFAKNVGLPGVIMHGMCTLAMSMDALLDHWVDGDQNALVSVACRFSHIVLPGGTLTVKTKKDGNKIFFETVEQNGETAISDGVIVVH